jgi:hypothetical protein
LFKDIKFFDLIIFKSPRIIDLKTALALHLAPGTPEIIEVKFFVLKSLFLLITRGLRPLFSLAGEPTPYYAATRRT